MVVGSILNNKFVLYTLLKLGGVIFAIELAIMYLLPVFLPGLHQGVETVLDALLVTLLSALICQKWLPLLASPKLNDGSDQIATTSEKALAWLSQISKFAIVLFSIEGAIMLLLPENHASLGSYLDAFILAIFSPPLIYGAFSSLRHPDAEPIPLQDLVRPFLFAFLPSLALMILLGTLAYLAEVRTGEAVFKKEVDNHLQLVKTQINQHLIHSISDLILLSNQDFLYIPSPSMDARKRESIEHHLRNFFHIKNTYQEIWLMDQNHQTIVKATHHAGRVQFDFPAADSSMWMSNLSLMASVQPIIHPLGKVLSGGSVEPGQFPPIVMGAPAVDEQGVKLGQVLMAVSTTKMLLEVNAIAEETGGRLVIHDSHGKLWHDSQPNAEPPLFPSEPFSHSERMDSLAISTGQDNAENERDAIATRYPLNVAMPTLQLTLTISRDHLTQSLRPFLTTLFFLGIILIPLLALGNWTLVIARYRHRQAEMALVKHANELERIVNERTRQLVHADRLATLGTFSAGMAHEINNPNAFIASNIDFLKLYWKLARPILERHKDEDTTGRISRFADEIDQALGGILDGSQRITKIVSSLKTYSKGGMNSDLVVCRLLEPIQDAQNLLQFKIKKDVTILLEVPNDHVLICDRQQMAQVFVNLLQNSMDAMEGNTDQKEIRIQSTLTGEHYWIRVQDNGSGIPKEAIEKIFDPFYTTKGKTKGTGLGLSIVHGIITDHYGQISAFNHDQGGAEFLVILPT
ncbi:MAG: GHKL domain-containing protein, partial [Magnetococcales bacterium]|nr:GHKL domain-containing protein [Magnetococcales bacterium]